LVENDVFPWCLWSVRFGEIELKQIVSFRYDDSVDLSSRLEKEAVRIPSWSLDPTHPLDTLPKPMIRLPISLIKDQYRLPDDSIPAAHGVYERFGRGVFVRDEVPLGISSEAFRPLWGQQSPYEVDEFGGKKEGMVLNPRSLCAYAGLSGSRAAGFAKM
jgi:hypothetical protein